MKNMKSDNFFAIFGAIILCVCIILCIAFPDEMFNSDTPRYNTTSKDTEFDFQYETLETIEPFDFESLFTASVTCFNNVGPGFGIVGPAGSFADFTDASKILLSIAMIFGRLEVFPLLIAIIPSTWKKH